jgi:hypothetical protein
MPMPGFGAVVNPATKQLASQLGSLAGSALAVPFDFSKKAVKGVYTGMENAQNEIADPVLKGKHGGRYQSAFGDNWLERNLVNPVAPHGSWARKKYNLGKHEIKTGAKGFAIGSVLSGAMYGLSAYVTDNPDNDLSDRGINVAKHAVAAGVDMVADLGLTGVAAGLATFGGPIGMMAGLGITAFNIGAGFLGMDAGSLAMNAMNHLEEQYDVAKAGPKFNMTQNTSMALQRQLSNLSMSGSNLGEMMHN